MTDTRRVRRCFVSSCPNTMLKTPNKLFFSIPQQEDIRMKWFEVLGKRYTPMWGKTAIHCCEDHFIVKDDIDNWMFYKTMSKKAKFKKNVVPHLFLDQPLNDPDRTQFSLEERRSKENNLMKLGEGKRAINDELETPIKVEDVIEENNEKVEIKKRKRGRPRKIKDEVSSPSLFAISENISPESIKEEVTSDIDEKVDIKCENNQDPLQFVDKYVQTDEVACCCDHKNCAELSAVKLLVINNGSTPQSLTFLNSTITQDYNSI